MLKNSTPKVAIIGAGITGLTVANRLNKALPELELTIFEKARGVSGRTSTRRAEPYHFDHGAPFFTVKSDAFKAFIKPMLEEGVLSDWQAKVVEVSQEEVIDRYNWQANKHFVGNPKMNEMAKFLAKDLPVKLGVRVGKIEQTHNHQWLLTSDTGKKVGKEVTETLTLGEHGDLGVFDWVICTAPAQQAAELVPNDLPFYPRITASNTVGCYALMLGFETPLNLNFDVALIKESPLSCMVVNSNKPNRPDAFALSILSSNQWAEEHIDTEQDWVKNKLLTTASKIVGQDLATANHIGMHRWRYANTSPELDQTNQNKPSYLFDADAKFAVAGDWLIKGSVENAFLSGDKLADALIELIKN